MGLTRTVEPAVQPLSLSEARKQVELGSDDTTHDEQLTRLIKTATRDVERYTRRALITQTWELRLHGFPGEMHKRDDAIYLPRPPLQSISSVVYTAEDGTSTTLASSLYQVTSGSNPAYLEPAYQEVWPTTRVETVEPLTITYIAGFGDSASDVPAEYVSLIAELVTFRFFNRGDVAADIPKHIRWSLNALRCGAVMGYYGIKEH